MNFRRRALYLSLKYLGGLLAALTGLYIFKYGALSSGTIVTGITCLVTYSFLYALNRGVSVSTIAKFFIPILVTIVTLRIATTFPDQSPLSSWFPLLAISGLFFTGRRYALGVIVFCFSIFAFLLYNQHHDTALWQAILPISIEIPTSADFFIRFAAATLILLFAFSYESQFAEAEEDKKRILSSMKIGLWQTDKIGKTIYFDDQCINILGLKSQEKEAPLEQFINTMPQGKQKEKLLSVLNSHESQPNFEFTFTIGDTFVRVKGESVYNKADQTIVLHGVLIDESEQEQLRRDLKKQEGIAGENARLASIGQLAAGLGHEINNPLAIIMGYSKKIEREFQNNPDTPEKLLKNFSKMKRASERISKIVHGLRGLSRSKNGVDDHFDVQNSIKDLYEMIFEIYQKEGVEVELELVPEELCVKGDESKFYQILMNLISNAKDAARVTKTPKVIIKCEKRQNAVVITVINGGLPIAEEAIDKLFVPFFTTKPENEGTGLGLSISHSFAESLDGQLYLEKSDVVDTRFALELPVVEIQKKSS